MPSGFATRERLDLTSRSPDRSPRPGRAPDPPRRRFLRARRLLLAASPLDPPSRSAASRRRSPLSSSSWSPPRALPARRPPASARSRAPPFAGQRAAANRPEITSTTPAIRTRARRALRARRIRPERVGLSGGRHERPGRGDDPVRTSADPSSVRSSITWPAQHPARVTSVDAAGPRPVPLRDVPPPRRLLRAIVEPRRIKPRRSRKRRSPRWRDVIHREAPAGSAQIHAVPRGPARSGWSFGGPSPCRLSPWRSCPSRGETAQARRDARRSWTGAHRRSRRAVLGGLRHRQIDQDDLVAANPPSPATPEGTRSEVAGVPPDAPQDFIRTWTR